MQILSLKITGPPRPPRGTAPQRWPRSLTTLSVQVQQKTERIVQQKAPKKKKEEEKIRILLGFHFYVNFLLISG